MGGLLNADKDAGGSLHCTPRIRTQAGSYLWMEVHLQRMLYPVTGEPSQVLLSTHDVTRPKMAQEELEALTLTDSLTGLGNRRAFDQALDREWRRAQREDTALSLLLIDINHFKHFNDSYGHQAGGDCY